MESYKEQQTFLFVDVAQQAFWDHESEQPRLAEAAKLETCLAFPPVLLIESQPLPLLGLGFLVWHSGLCPFLQTTLPRGKAQGLLGQRPGMDHSTSL